MFSFYDVIMTNRDNNLFITVYIDVKPSWLVLTMRRDSFKMSFVINYYDSLLVWANQIILLENVREDRKD